MNMKFYRCMRDAFEKRTPRIQGTLNGRQTLPRAAATQFYQGLLQNRIV